MKVLLIGLISYVPVKLYWAHVSKIGSLLVDGSDPSGYIGTIDCVDSVFKWFR